MNYTPGFRVLPTVVSKIFVLTGITSLVIGSSSRVGWALLLISVRNRLEPTGQLDLNFTPRWCEGRYQVKSARISVGVCPVTPRSDSQTIRTFIKK